MKQIEVPVSQLTPDELRRLELPSGTLTVKIDIPEPVQNTGPARPQVAIPPPTPAVAKRMEEITVESTLNVDGKFSQSKLGLPEVVDDLDIDKANFLAHILGAERFVKTYYRFGGKFSVTFRTLTAKEDDACVAAARAEHATNPDALMRTFLEYRMVASLSEYCRGDDRFVVDHSGSIQDCYATFLSLPHLITGLIRVLNEQFSKLVLDLYKESENEDFWKAGPAAS